MRGFLSLFSLFALASTSAFASPIDHPVGKCLDEFCGGKDFIEASPGPPAFIAKIEKPTHPIHERGPEEMTNADRFSRGLPPKKPKLLQGSPIRRTQASPCPVITHRGVIKVDKADGTGTLGYLAQDPNYWTPLLTPDINSATVISFTAESTHVSGLVSDLTIESGGQGGFNLLGPVVGRDSTSSNIAPGSFNYLYIGSTSHTPPNSTPQSAPSYFSTSTGLDKQTESGVWQWAVGTSQLTMQWLNTDSSTPTTYVWVQSNHLYAGGDPEAFHSRFPAPVTTVTLTFVPL